MNDVVSAATQTRVYTIVTIWTFNRIIPQAGHLNFCLRHQRYPTPLYILDIQHELVDEIALPQEQVALEGSEVAHKIEFRPEQVEQMRRSHAVAIRNRLTQLLCAPVAECCV